MELITINKDALRNLAKSIVALKQQVIQLEEEVRKIRMEGCK
jgi:predicted  nucleic acid-binding Zn-ribbon protein